MLRDLNLYQDDSHGGWILEILVAGRWTYLGTFGTRAAALASVGR